MNVYEVIFYGDSSRKRPLICKVEEELECKKLKIGEEFNGTLKMEIIQDGKSDDFVKNTDELLIVDKDIKVCFESNKIEDIQFIPVQIGSADYYVINILKKVSDSLDLQNSKYMIYPDNFPNEKVRGKIGTIWQTVLLKDKIDGHIFRIEEHLNDIFVDEYLKTLIENNGFSGIDFNKVKVL